MVLCNPLQFAFCCFFPYVFKECVCETSTRHLDLDLEGKMVWYLIGAYIIHRTCSWLLGDMKFVFSAEKYFTHSHCWTIQKTFHILAQPYNILSINTCTSQQYHNDLHVFTRIMTTNPMSRNTSTTELIMDNQWIWKVSK